MNKAVRKVRRAQLIGPYGPGAIVDLVGESFVAEDASRWRGRPVTIRMPRLAARLNVQELRSPSAFPGVPYFRFPTWLFCRHCRLMSRRLPEDEKDDQPPMCRSCKDLALVPMRFVAVCGDGHLSDIDWHRWSHRDPDTREQKQCQDRTQLHFMSNADRGSGLESLEILCRRCKASSNLQHITSRGMLRERCSGRQPWQAQALAVQCDKQVIGTQRGASNVYFPEVVSALDLPPDSDWENFNSTASLLRSNLFFRAILEAPSARVKDDVIAMLADEVGVSPPEVEQALAEERRTRAAQANIGTEKDIIPEEWHALTNPRNTIQNHLDHFITRRADLPRPNPEHQANSQGLEALLADVILVDRLREVRVLKGFHRYTAEQMVPANLGDDKEFLPAIEVFGEGFFITFKEELVRGWEEKAAVQQRHLILRDRARKADLRWLPPVTARYLMLHSMAHLLLRSTAFDAGYPVSALQERIYATDPEGGPSMAGILIYTAAGDSEGTLGGLVRMGEFHRLQKLMTNAVIDAQWCSLDPVCGESTSQGPAGLSLAACHACTLLPETSCQAGNRLLDRQLVIDPQFGFLASLAASFGGVPGRGA
jgi:hypothetical protein